MRSALLVSHLIVFIALPLCVGRARACAGGEGFAIGEVATTLGERRNNRKADDGQDSDLARTSRGESVRWFRRENQQTSGRYCCHAAVATMRVPHEITLDEAQDPEQKTGPKSSPV